MGRQGEGRPPREMQRPAAWGTAVRLLHSRCRSGEGDLHVPELYHTGLAEVRTTCVLVLRTDLTVLRVSRSRIANPRTPGDVYPEPSKRAGATQNL